MILYRMDGMEWQRKKYLKKKSNLKNYDTNDVSQSVGWCDIGGFFPIIIWMMCLYLFDVDARSYGYMGWDGGIGVYNTLFSNQSVLKMFLRMLFFFVDKCGT